MNDFLVRVESDLDFWIPSGALGVARTIGSTTIAAAAGVSASGAYATLPNPPAMGPVYQQYVAPALSRDATRSLTTSGSLAVRHRVTERLAFEGFGWWNRTTIRGAPAEFGPDGRYNQWEVGAAVVLGR